MKAFVIGMACVALAGGCGTSYELYPVNGSVQFQDGSIPQAEIAIIRFEPIRKTGENAKGASGTIDPQDGSFELMTMKPGDGVFPGDYKVVFTVWSSYTDRLSLVDEKFTHAKTTPLDASVKAGQDNHFKFRLDRP